MIHREKVLCIKRERLPAAWVRKKSVMDVDESLFFETCDQAGFEFKEREIVETNPLFKQIIPYVVIQTQDLKLTAAYLRSGSERRLHDLWSVGIGGHINPEDCPARSSFREVLTAGMMRELDEEMVKRPDNELPSFCGIINEEETPVGCVHLGAVFTLETQNPTLFIPGPELADFTWKRTETVTSLNLELWSRLALELMGYNGHALTDGHK
ncbi:MAG: phosphoesterase [Desulfobacterium sp.]|jgi:predicted NUDIX family phosphoesterase|nr:phosphoesterase [Desulfobacterium sp.]